MTIERNVEEIAKAHVLAGETGEAYLSINVHGTLRALEPSSYVFLSKEVFLMTNNAAAQLQAWGFSWDGEQWLAPSESDWSPIGEVRLGEYDGSGAHPDARVVCLHTQADWENFADGTKVYLRPAGQEGREEPWKSPASPR